MEIRKILPTEYPTVTNIDGTTRVATLAEMLGLGFAHLGGDYFDVNDNAPAAGTKLAEGFNRYRALPTADAPNILRARVERQGTDANGNPAIVVLLIPESEVKTTDTVLAKGLRPHDWAGERGRRVISGDEFTERFTDAERAKMRRSTDEHIAKMREKTFVNPLVNLDSPVVIGTLNYLVTAAVLTADRPDQIRE